MKSTIIYLMTVIAVLSVATAAFPTVVNEGDEKRAILVVSFGTSDPEARKAIDNLVDTAASSFQDITVRVAYTSNIIRRKIAKEQGLNIPTPTEALAALNDEGFSTIYVVPTHIIPGEEYDDLKGVVDAFASLKGKYGFKKILIGKPFLNSASDCDIMAGELSNMFKKQLSEKGTVVVMMGHGSPHHIGNAMYSQLQLSLDKAAYGRFFVGTVEAAPTIEDVIFKLGKASGAEKIEKIVLAPFMIVAGDHAKNDMADGDDPESWVSLLKKAGYTKVESSLIGLGSTDEIRSLFIDRLKELMETQNR